MVSKMSNHSKRIKLWRANQKLADRIIQDIPDCDLSFHSIENLSDESLLSSGEISCVNPLDRSNVELALHDLDSASEISVDDVSCDGSEGEVSFSSAEGNPSTDAPVDIHKELAAWMSDFRVTRNAGNALLKILNQHFKDLPLDCRTLLSTKRSVATCEKAGGEYVYFGLTNYLLSLISSKPAQKIFHVQINIDGAQKFKSKKASLWPILVSVNKSQPQVIALWHGNGKPTNIHSYLEDFIVELRELVEGSVHDLEGYEVVIDAIVCDAPARAMLKQITGHTGCHGCERCCVVGKRVNNRTVFLDVNSAVRFDEMFDAESYEGTHQIGSSPFSGLVGCVTKFVLDYMHLVCLGVMKRMVKFWREERASPARLSDAEFRDIGSALGDLSLCLPSDMARQPRSLDEWKFWKATEWRQFMLYTGPVVLLGRLRRSYYHHFISLSLAMSILLDDDDAFRTDNLEYARELLVVFVEKSKVLYGDWFLSYNIHNLVHLVDDCVNHGCSLNDISCFPYENFLGSLTRLVRNGSSVVTQISKRISESAVIGKAKIRAPKLNDNLRDGSVLLKDGKLAIIIGFDDGDLLVKRLPSRIMADLYVVPCRSKLFNIGTIRKSQLTEISTTRAKRSDILRKVACVPYGDGGNSLALLPLRHRLNL